METKMGKRRFPKSEHFLKHKDIDAQVYSILQCYSKRNPDKKERYIYDKNINRTLFAKELGITRPTFINKLNNLKKNNLIIEKEDEDKNKFYILPCDGYGVLIDWEVLKYLIGRTNSNTLKTYIVLKYFHEQYIPKGEKVFPSLKFLCKEIGLSDKSEKSMNACLVFLLENKLIKREEKYEHKNGITKKTYHYQVLK